MIGVMKEIISEQIIIKDNSFVTVTEIWTKDYMETKIDGVVVSKEPHKYGLIPFVKMSHLS